MKRIQVNLNKDQIQKLALSTIGFIVLLYVYFSFFLGPLNNSRDTAEAQITELQGKVASSKNELSKTANLEKQADASTKRFAALKALSPEGAPIAWFPPRLKAFFANQEIDKATARFETSVPFKETDLAGWMRYNWAIELPQADFSTLGKAVAALETPSRFLRLHTLALRHCRKTPSSNRSR